MSQSRKFENKGHHPNYLSILNKDLKADDFILICTEIKNCNTLKRLTFHDCTLDEAGIILLLSELRKNQTLLELGFFDTKISEKTVINLAELLKDNSVLQELVLDQAGLTDKGISALANTLEKNQTLLRLVIKNETQTKIKNDCFMKLAAGLELNQSLQILSLINCPGISWLIYPFAKALAVNQSLKYLKLTDNLYSIDKQINQYNIEYLATTLKSNQNLIGLTVKNHSMDASDLQALAPKLQQNKNFQTDYHVGQKKLLSLFFPGELSHLIQGYVGENGPVKEEKTRCDSRGSLRLSS